jgi:cysteine desulfuration protein SufE
MDQAPTIAEEEERLRDEFELLDDPRDKYEHIIDLGRQLPPLPEAARIDANLVRGCQSRVWLTAEFDQKSGRLNLFGDSDAIISKGLLALALRLYAGRTPHEILANSPGVFEAIGLGRLITPGRSNGLYAVVNRVQRLAEAYAAVPAS